MHEVAWLRMGGDGVLWDAPEPKGGLMGSCRLPARPRASQCRPRPSLPRPKAHLGTVTALAVSAQVQPPQAVIDALVEEGKGLGEPEYKKDGTMTFDFFLETNKIITKYVIQQTRAGLAEHAVKRRAAIAAGNEEEFQKLVMATANWEQLTQTLIQANLYQALKVPKQVFEKSAQVYLMEPSKRTIYEEEL